MKKLTTLFLVFLLLGYSSFTSTKIKNSTFNTVVGNIALGAGATSVLTAGSLACTMFALNKQLNTKNKSLAQTRRLERLEKVERLQKVAFYTSAGIGIYAAVAWLLSRS